MGIANKHTRKPVMAFHCRALHSLPALTSSTCSSIRFDPVAWLVDVALPAILGNDSTLALAEFHSVDRRRCLLRTGMASGMAVVQCFTAATVPKRLLNNRDLAHADVTYKPVHQRPWRVAREG